MKMRKNKKKQDLQKKMNSKVETGRSFSDGEGVLTLNLSVVM